jgi:PBSX family phage terminase large subunit
MTYIAEAIDAPAIYGAALDFWEYKGQEAILAGPYETGKTFTALYKLHTLLCIFPRSRALMVRKTYKSVRGSAVVTYEDKVLPVPPTHPQSAVRKYGGEEVQFYQYPNGSRLIVGGMDNPDKFLSAEYDFIYVNQAEELTLDDWEKLMGRATGRAGNAPYTQIMGDCNPGPPTHWIRQRKTLRLFESRHEDNPTLYSHTANEWTEQGRKSLAILDSLTGVRYKRGRLGLWVAAEGQVYEYDPALHTTQWRREWDSRPRYRAIDFGYTNPFTCLWFVEDYDSRLIMYRQLYMTGRTVRRHAEQINALSQGERIAATICDHDAEDRATLNEHGIRTIAADKRITVGIEKVQERLARAHNGKPRIMFVSDSLVEVDTTLKDRHQPLCVEDEFAMYVYPEGVDGKPVKEEPVDMYNHGMDALRYMVMYLDRPGAGGRRARVGEY